MSHKDDFDEYIKQLQAKIDKRALEDFSPRVIELYKNPVNWGIMWDSDFEDELLGPCGDTVSFFLKINKDTDIIEEISFMTDGCGPSIASASQTSILVKNKSVSDALKITPEDVNKELGSLPPDHTHCPLLAVNALRKVLKKFHD